jgi:hypothetical protein
LRSAHQNDSKHIKKFNFNKKQILKFFRNAVYPVISKIGPRSVQQGEFWNIKHTQKENNNNKKSFIKLGILDMTQLLG